MDLNIISQKQLPVIYKGIPMDFNFRLDLLVEQKVVVELKAVEAIDDVHMAQMMTYLKLTNNKLGLIVNFNVPLLKHGIKRIIHGKLE
jgi:GxxExxY protein